MIRIDRGEEPIELTAERSRRLARASLHGRPRESTDLEGYNLEEVRTALLGAQRYRCAYCEIPIDDAAYPIEHFRPKARADDVQWRALPEPEPSDYGLFLIWYERYFGDERRGPSPWTGDSERYWWLAWTWENLFFACPTCNTATNKGNKFPLERGSPRMAEWEEPPGSELPLLLNPATTDPLDHLRFAPDLTSGTWGPIALDHIGRWTIAVLGLHRRTGLRGHWKGQAKQIEGDGVFKEALAAKANGDHAAVRASWAGLLAQWFHAESDYVALRWCIFDHHFPETYRTEHGLSLPRPGTPPRACAQGGLGQRPE